jgi:hypothetical protein
VRAISGTSIIGIQEYWKAMIGGGTASSAITGGVLTPAAPSNTSSGIYYVGGAASITLNLANGLTQEILLDRATTEIADAVFGSDPVTPGTRFIIIIRVDGTPGRLVTWGSSFFGLTFMEIESKANSINIYEMLAMSDGSFLRCNVPAIGVF